MRNMTRTSLFIFCLLAASIAGSSCKKDKDTLLLGDDYFPLSVGNNWKLEHLDLREIVGKTTLENKEYYIMTINSDSIYYRRDGNSILQKTQPTGESVLFRLDANVGDSWQFPMGSGSSAYNVTLASKTDTVIINGKQFTNCYHFFFDAPLVVDEEHSVVLAPGIGYIKENCGFCPYPQLLLEHAKIDSVEISL
jgi:hypothetical protein